ncbi:MULTISPECIES: potassium-transporting ATPase subunit C [Clostridium]|uniref:Potassium-transporting ATPase subunit C n=1 Tax=Clostridium frigoriphilum TaxID=443253 RepID=A0ABU7UMI6_9CLOT|nr:potassium-transporting ATPase subunit C [Clostridium sp. DSM 17811]MBU3100111.1 potassium-transporting ATPase subunit C [Clostridium sp. DSM 17811]
MRRDRNERYVKKISVLTVLLFVLCGLIYPLAMTGISQVLFNKKANLDIANILKSKGTL